ncbi:MFS general substrate transporter [Lentinula edodes]|nr:MFS general substrate transporter [Lentinula edodes]
MSKLQEDEVSYVIQSNDIMPIEATFAHPQTPFGELGQPLNREKSIIGQLSVKADTESATTLIPLEDAYPDGGLRAWLVVLGCFLYACTVFGWGLNWGVLQDYYHTTMFPNTSLSVLGTIIGLANFGIGMPLYFSLCSQWFLKRRGLATGIAVSGSGIGGGIETLLMRQLIVKIGYRNTMLTFSSLHAVIWIFAWFLLKERLHPGLNPTAKKRWLPKKITGSFCSVALSMFFGVFGYLTPYYLSATYTRQMVTTLDSNSLLVTVPLIVMNFCLGIGRITAGRLADIFGATNMFFCSFFIGGLLQMVFWTFARSYATIMVFSVLNGLIGSWFMSLLPVVCAKLFGVEGLSTITGFMILANSPGQFVGTTIAAVVLSSSGNNWTAVSLYSGSMQIMGALCILYA